MLIYGVQSFRMSHRGWLDADPIIPVATRQAAERTAALMAPLKAGVFAFALLQGQGSAGTEPIILAEYGTLPPETDALARALPRA